MKRQKSYVRIYEEKEECKLCDNKKNLTFHHIIPQKEIIFNGAENLMVLCRKCHNIIDVSIVQRDEFCYNKNKIIIDKYNKFLIDNRFPEDLLWSLYKEEKVVKIKKKRKKRKRNSGQNLKGNNIKKEKIYSKRYLKLLEVQQNKYRKIQEKKDKEKENVK